MVYLEKFNLVQKIRIKDDKRFAETSFDDDTLVHTVTIKNLPIKK